MKLIRIERLAYALLVMLMAVATSSCGAKRSGPGAVDPDAPTEYSLTDSGLKYRILRRGSDRKPVKSDRVVVDYYGRLDDGTVFDSSYERREASNYALASMIKGWSEGVQLIGEGGMVELEIPPELGYGREGKQPKIPPNATLYFKIELHNIP